MPTLRTVCHVIWTSFRICRATVRTDTVRLGLPLATRPRGETARRVAWRSIVGGSEGTGETFVGQVGEGTARVFVPNEGVTVNVDVVVSLGVGESIEPQVPGEELRQHVDGTGFPLSIH